MIGMKIIDKNEFDKINCFGKWDINSAYAKSFIGNSYLKPLTDSKKTVFLANITFEPGCRNNWHIHKSTKCEVKY